MSEAEQIHGAKTAKLAACAIRTCTHACMHVLLDTPAGPFSVHTHILCIAGATTAKLLAPYVHVHT